MRMKTLASMPLMMVLMPRMKMRQKKLVCLEVWRPLTIERGVPSCPSLRRCCRWQPGHERGRSCSAASRAWRSVNVRAQYREVERGPLAIGPDGTRVEPYVAAEQFHDVFADCEAQARTAGFSRERCIALREGLEEARREVRRYARSRVLHREADVVVLAFEVVDDQLAPGIVLGGTTTSRSGGRSHLLLIMFYDIDPFRAHLQEDGPAHGRELDGVGQEVDQYLLQPRAVSFHDRGQLLVPCEQVEHAAPPRPSATGVADTVVVVASSGLLLLLSFFIFFIIAVREDVGRGGTG